MRTRVLGIGVIFAVAGLAPFASMQAQESGYGGDSVDCTSHDYAPERCQVVWRDAQLVQQLSKTRCVRDQNWGFDRDGLWVNGGCSGRFVAVDDRDRDRRRDGGIEYGRERERDRERDHDRERQDANERWEPDASWNQRFSVTCESQDRRDRFCQVDVGGGGSVYLERQLSNTSCVEGASWGWNRGGVWVTQGCRGVFTVDRRWR